MVSAAKRRVRGILEQSDAGQALKAHLFACARACSGPWAQYLDPDHCENRALVIEPGGFISTHKDSREGDLTCVHFLTGSGSGQPVNSVGICARIWGGCRSWTTRKVSARLASTMAIPGP